MRLESEGIRLRIYIREDDRFDGVPLYDAIVERARLFGLAGATVVRGLEGFGVRNRIHGVHSASVAQDLPVTVEIVDQRVKIDAFLPSLDEMVAEGLVTKEAVEVILYRLREPEQRTH
ncbi:MAG TPA: DUF190 domain-containing protein [Thermoanaerobaculia bacterium]|nr:DUF190 domain-containing protein [Thermoanaerobaculia bacterium]